MDVTDWDRDGDLDIVASAANGRVRVFLNNGSNGKVKFSEGIDPKLPLIEQPRVLMVDINRDGDKDLYLPSTQGSCFIERSFLESGYAEAQQLKFERRDSVTGE